MKRILITLVLLTLQGVLAQADNVDVTVTVDNVGATAYVLTEVIGENVGEVGTENAGWTLQVGRRYRVVNNGEVLFHPFELRSDTDVLLAQGNLQGIYEEDPSVDFVSDDMGISFTLTPGLAELLSNYRCTFHPMMTGTISAASAP